MITIFFVGFIVAFLSRPIALEIAKETSLPSSTVPDATLQLVCRR